MKTTRTALITDHLKLPRYSMADFWVCSPFELDDYKPDERPGELRGWRQVGMVWARLSGYTQHQAGKMFFRDHATALHSEKVILDTLIDYRRGCPHVKKALDEIRDHCKSYSEKFDDSCLNELISLVQLESARK